MVKISETDRIVEVELKPHTVIVPERPEVIESKTYKVRSPKIGHAVYVTIGFLNDRPFEIFINSKDLSKAPEYAVLTRLISAVFRAVDNPEFIIDELESIYDPSGGYFKQGKYYHSFYSEIADVIKDALYTEPKQEEETELIIAAMEADDMKICPECGQRTLKMENGCMICVNPECGYSKCDH